MADIHATAIVDPKAQLGAGVKVGPYCVIGPDVKLGEGSVLHSHVVIDGRTTIGPRAKISPFASLGQPPQDLKYHGERSELEVGADAMIREYVTMNTGTEGGGTVTRVGDNCTVLSSVHIGHDCQIGNNVILSSAALLAGHCRVDDNAIFGGGAAVHQFVRVGRNAFIGGASAVESDIIPFGLVVGNRASLMGLNLVGLKRHNFSRERINAMRDAYGQIFSADGTMRDRVAATAERFADNADVMEIVNFIQSASDRPLCLPSR
ncbi:MAG: acyl-ACP--UDP-N-acetylglucosamine O-acyltransferase [Parvibaculum sp.]|uniref:acyl-ACP--UDP-N-acetylglucosamine O-acyltransferase n=1 Tax=Parvibaculum sp. TaxID=2024848 RepID=UPI0025FD32D2|nr:acyl-ACP--UDP-N-acetylglucosamine O-acyltransferase [Parvibaculum sp.]MCE9651423.1 acyl-ACP--UDP-N-acetylglucosamine O-acyltransferase [Parvibaculum sp.]